MPARLDAGYNPKFSPTGRWTSFRDGDLQWIVSTDGQVRKQWNAGTWIPGRDEAAVLLAQPGHEATRGVDFQHLARFSSLVDVLFQRRCHAAVCCKTPAYAAIKGLNDSPTEATMVPS